MPLDMRPYALANAQTMQTPALVYYRAPIEENTRRAIALAHGASRLWPHVKSHKTPDMIRMQQRMGISRFKCATIAEAQMAASCGAAHILLAYPLVGPNMERFLQLQTLYSDSTFYAIGDDAEQIRLLSAAAAQRGIVVNLLMDVNIGMNRTGALPEKAAQLYTLAESMPYLAPMGLHCYDGHIHDASYEDRSEHAQNAASAGFQLRDALRAQGHACALMVLGGTPTFPIHARQEGVFLSPGTVFLGDGMCLEGTPEQGIVPAVGIWARVISHPAEGLFAIDLGTKAISTDQPQGPGQLVGMEGARPLFQSEEHWVFQVEAPAACPAIGSMVFVVPSHICPTNALYPFAYVADGGRIIGKWNIVARDRNIGI